MRNFEDLLFSYVGEFGWFQPLLLLATGAPGFLTGLEFMEIIFLLQVPKHWCKLGGQGLNETGKITPFPHGALKDLFQIKKTSHMASQSKVNVASASIKTQIELTGRGMTQAMYLSHVQNGIMTSLSLGMLWCLTGTWFVIVPGYRFSQSRLC